MKWLLIVLASLSLFVSLWDFVEQETVWVSWFSTGISLKRADFIVSLASVLMSARWMISCRHWCHMTRSISMSPAWMWWRMSISGTLSSTLILFGPNLPLQLDSAPGLLTLSDTMRLGRPFIITPKIRIVLIVEHSFQKWCLFFFFLDLLWGHSKETCIITSKCRAGNSDSQTSSSSKEIGGEWKRVIIVHTLPSL